MGIDSVQPKPAPVISKSEPKPIEPAKVETTGATTGAATTPAALKTTEGFDELKKKLMSVSGRYVAPPPVVSDRADLKELVSQNRFAAQSNLVAGNTVGSDEERAANLESLKKTIKTGDDEDIRKAIIANPRLLDDKEITPELKGKAMKRLERGSVSDGDKHAMQFIVRSCESKEELRDTIKAATGKKEVGQADFHKFDKHLTNYHDFLVADLLNPANALPETTQTPPKVEKPDPNVLGPAVDAKMKAGDFDGATKIIEEHKKKFGTDTKHDPWPGTNGFEGKGDRSTVIDKKEMTSGEIADVKLKQVDQAREMSKVMGKTVDPHDPRQVKEYFDKISKPAPPAKGATTTGEITQKYGDYVRNFSAPASKAEWGPTPPMKDRSDAATVGKMFEGQPRDVMGRPALDCEGQAYLASAMFKNNPRFDVVHAHTNQVGNGHISTCVFEKGKPTQGFAVNPLHRGTVNPLEVADGAPQMKLLKQQYPTVKQQQEAIAARHHMGSKADGDNDGTVKVGSGQAPRLRSPKDPPLSPSDEAARIKTNRNFEDAPG